MNKINTFSFIFLLSQAFCLLLNAQPDSSDVHLHWHKKNLSLTVAYQSGYVMPTNVFVRGSNTHSVVIDDFQVLSLKLSTQTTGNHLWERLLNYPSWGVGLKALDFFDIKEIGIPIAAYGFMDIPLARLDRFALNCELGFGLTFNWRSFNPVTNQYNVAIGAGQAFMSEAGLNVSYGLTRNIDVVAGANFSHYSNGAIKLPNFGLNAVAPKVGVKYNFYERPRFIRQPKPKFDPRNEWTVSAFAAMKNIIFDSVDVNIKEKYEGVFFPVYGISGLYSRQISHFSKIGVGMTFDFNESVNAQVKVDNNEIEDIDGLFVDQLQLSIYPSYELCLDKVSVMLQPAFYIFRKASRNLSPTFHQRITLKYMVTDNIFAGITLRDYSMHADFVEWTLGYRFNNKGMPKKPF
ncbi:MAG TPA: acyloxyacyl hydrolase [Paludibacter sp.]|nr:acyloxyacyl hydrolase [Paludibacter sp.]